LRLYFVRASAKNLRCKILMQNRLENVKIDRFIDQVVTAGFDRSVMRLFAECADGDYRRFRVAVKFADSARRGQPVDQRERNVH
jgi:hypothetical protein